MPNQLSILLNRASAGAKPTWTNLPKVIGVALSLLLTFGQNPGYGQGHLQTWNTNQRERSQKLLSGAMTALNKGLVDQASNLLIQATLADPSDPVSLTMLGTTYVRQGKYSEALESLKKSYQLSKSAETLLSTGFAYYLQHDYDAAISSWSRALERDPKMVEANADIGFAYLRKGSFAQADESFRNLINARPNSQLAYQGLALLNYLAGNFAAARKAADHAQSIQSYYPVLLLLAKLDYLQGDAQNGQKRVNEWLKASSGKRALLRPMTALGYPLQHDFHWDPFLADNFDNGRLLMARTQSTEKNGDSRRKSLASQGKGDTLLSEAKRASSAAPSDFYILRELALIEMANGNYTECIDHFSDAISICPSCRVDWLHKARALAMQGKSAEASYAVNAFLRQRPNEKIAQPFLEIAKGTPAQIPDLSPQADPHIKPSGSGDSGF